VRSEAVMTMPRLRVVRPEEVAPAVARAKAERSTRRMLATLTLSVVVLTMAGLVMVLSASSVSAFARYGSSFLFFKRQLLYACMGGVVALVVSRVRYQVWQKAWAPLFVLTLGLLALVLDPSFGTTVGGAARWIQVAGFSLQPSEFAKFVVVAAVAAILSRNLRYLSEPILWIAPIALVVGSVMLLILLQPDMGTAMVIGATVFVLLFVAGVRLRHLALGGGVALLGALALIMRPGYRHARFLAFLHPWSDPQNSGYHIIQSLIALGSGHLFGVGLGASRQKWMYVPNAHTDFIFSIMGEELGLIGEVVVLALFGAFIYAGIRIALRAPDSFGRILAAGITGWLGLQALINLGAVTGVLPVTGVPLPFMSFGGSSLIVSLGAVGVLLSIGRAELPSKMRRRKPVSGKPSRRTRSA
jgi:cell division protein FtsW